MEIKIFHVLRKGEKLFIDSAEIAEGDTILYTQNLNPSIGSENEQEFKKGLVSCLNKFFPSMEISVKEIYNPEYKRISELLNKSIAECDLSIRVFNCLNLVKLVTLKKIIMFHQKKPSSFENGFLSIRKFGKKSLKELEEFLQEKGLSLDMDLTPYEEKK